MKKFCIISIAICLMTTAAFAASNRTSEEYLKNKKHFSILNPFAENCAEKIIKKALKKEVGNGHYKVKFECYTVSSLKKGIFKTLNIQGKKLLIDNIPVKSLNLNTQTDYNWIDFKASPIKVKSDIIFDYNLELSEESLNQALEDKDYQKIINKINLKAYPLFELKDVKIKIKNDRIYLIIDYILPLNPNRKNRAFIVSSEFKVENGKIKAKNVHIDKSYGNLPLDKVANLINLLDPLTFTLNVLKEDNCQGKVENVMIKDNNIQINGKIFIKKGE